MEKVRIDYSQEPRLGDYESWAGTAHKGGELLFKLIYKLTGTELKIAMNRGCVKDRQEAIDRMKESLKEAAEKKLCSGVGKKCEEIHYSPCR